MVLVCLQKIQVELQVLLSGILISEDKSDEEIEPQRKKKPTNNDAKQK